MSEGNKFRFCWRIHIAIQYHGKVLKRISFLNSDVHDTNNPLIKGYPMLFLIFFPIILQ